jgi:hypothetical protein
MKLKIYLALATIFFTLNAMRCNNDIFGNSTNLIDIDVENLCRDGENLNTASSPIRKESYTLGIKYIGKDSVEQPYLSFYQDSVLRQKIYCNTQFDARHPAGSDVTKFFVLSPNRKYNGAKLRLIKRPDSGTHSFKICIYRKDGLYIEKDTAPIEFF